jgi:hypothetical protein
MVALVAFSKKIPVAPAGVLLDSARGSVRAALAG